MKDKKAAKTIIRRAKEHPGWYTDEVVRFAKMVKKRIKQAKQAKKDQTTGLKRSIVRKIIGKVKFLMINSKNI